MKKVISSLLIGAMLLSFAACGNRKQEEPVTTTTTAPVVTQKQITHYDLNDIDLETLGEIFAQSNTKTHRTFQLDGLCTPVIMEMRGTEIVSISAYGTTVSPNQRYNFSETLFNIYFYGFEVTPAIYDHEGIIFLNIWQPNSTGYTCVIFPDGTYRECYPEDGYTVMIYVDEENRMIQSRFALKFLNLEDWPTGAIERAFSRDDFYYSIEDAAWTAEAGYTTTAREYYTISDWFELDEIFDTAKKNGQFSIFETLDSLLEHNAEYSVPLTPEYITGDPDTVEDKIGHFGQDYVSYVYDSQHNLLLETFYNDSGASYFRKAHTYDSKNREIYSSWRFGGANTYFSTDIYDSRGRLAESIWYRRGQEIERFVYSYFDDGRYSKTFIQEEERKYTYTFDETGELIAHCVYKNGIKIETEDVSTLVKTQLLTDVFFPTMDTGMLHVAQYYDGTVPIEDPSEWTTHAHLSNGDYVLIRSETDEENGIFYETLRQYNPQDQLVKVTYREDGIETTREEYQYDENRCARMICYQNDQQIYTDTYVYDDSGKLSRIDTDNLNPEYGAPFSKVYLYDHRGLVTDVVVYSEGEEVTRSHYDYDSNGYVLPSTDTYQYVYNAEGILEGIWLLYEDHAAGLVQLRSHTVYVTPENARQLQEIMRNELSWF